MNKTSQVTDNDHAAEERLRAAHVRVTGARLDVFGTLLAKQRALSHTELQDALPTMDRVTLYRALDCLSEAGLAHKIIGEDRVFRFSTGNELTANVHTGHTQHQHGHFTCIKCLQVFCLESPEENATLKEQLRITLEATKLRGFQSHHIEVTIKGWCIACANLQPT
jgi:Fur family ferric uptake transcriptional regulator